MSFLSPRTRGKSPLRAFTLIEMVLAATILSIILLGMQSAMVLAAPATPDRASPTSFTVASGRAINRLSAELGYATSIVSATANSVEFVVPDRTGDASPETIRYSWSGIAGAPLLRTINGGTALTVAPNVHEFALTFDKKTQQKSTTYTESGEILLNSYDGAGILNLGNFNVNSDDQIGQYFLPSLPGSAAKWRLTRVKFRAQKNSSDDGRARVQIRTAIGGLPGVILEEAYMYESALDSNYTWREFSFSNVSGRPPNTGLCLVIEDSGPDEACYILFHSLLAGGANAQLVKTLNGGTSWSTPSGQDMVYYVYGTYSTIDPVAYNYWLTGVRCTLRCGTDSGSRVRTTIRVLNEPQVSGP